jgi:hypothetical protein
VPAQRQQMMPEPVRLRSPQKWTPAA